SRLLAGGCRRSVIKSLEAPGPSKNASQEWSAGLMRRLRPSLVTSTWRTLGGKAIGFGNRTAWLRLVVKTVERATWTLRSGISQRDIRISCRFVKRIGVATGLDRSGFQSALDRTLDVSIGRAL